MLKKLKRNDEIDVIHRIIVEGSIRRAVSLGLDEKYFSDITALNAFNFIREYSERQATRGETPSMKYLRDKVPTFPDDIEVPERTLPELIEVVRTGALDRSMRGLTADLDKLLTDFRSPEHAFSHAVSEIKRLTRVSGVLPSHLAMDVGEACSMLRKEYESKRKGGGITGIPCPWSPLNNAYGGLEPGTLHVVYAPSKHGKTWFSLELAAVHPFLHSHARVLIISCEMPINQMYRRMMARFSEVDYHGVINGSLCNSEQERYLATLDRHQQEQEDVLDIGDGGHRCIRVIRPSSRTGAGVESIRNAVDLFEPDILLVDAVYRLAGKNGARDYKWNAIQENIAELKDLSGEKNMPVIVTAQANRTGWKSVEEVDFDDYGDMSMSAGFIQEADAVYRLQKFSLPDHSERILVTIPALRDAKVDPFTIHFRPCYDFSLDCDRVTRDYLAGLVAGTPVYQLGYEEAEDDITPDFNPKTKGIFD